MKKLHHDSTPTLRNLVVNSRIKLEPIGEEDEKEDEEFEFKMDEYEDNGFEKKNTLANTRSNSRTVHIQKISTDPQLIRYHQN